MKNIFTIIKKEFSRFFKDKRMIITVLLPGVLIFALYSILGTVITDMVDGDKDYKPTAYIMGANEEQTKTFGFIFDLKVECADVNEAKSKIEEGTLDLAIIFPENFTTELGTTPAPDVKIYYDSTNDNSLAGYNAACVILESWNVSAFTVNSSPEKFDLAGESDFAVKMLSMLVPMLMFSLLSAACMSVAPESIAGEKERGTMATMLITPIKRSELALGKILSLTCFALLSGISSFLGVILSLPKLMGGMISADAALMYNFGDYMLIFAVIISVVLVIISAFSVVSAFSKSVKESGALLGPLMIVIILLGMFSMFVSGTPSIGLYFIPLLGSGLAMSSIMSMTANLLGVWMSVLVNLIVSAALVVLLTFMFKSERIMFKK